VLFFCSFESDDPPSCVPCVPWYPGANSRKSKNDQNILIW